MEKKIKENKGRGPVMLMGDLNARPMKAKTEEEQRIIGPYTFEPETERVKIMSDEEFDNRNRLQIH